MHVQLIPASTRMPDKWRRVQKHEVQVERKSSDELLHELHSKLLELSRCGDADRRHPRYCEH
jgi:hypothetical protein